MDRRGVISRGCIRMSTSIPSAVRRVCAKDIERLDKELRDASTDDEWVRLVDGPPDTVVFRITVQGFPRRKVEYAFSLLQSVVDVSVFKCDTVEKQKLLYGVGQKFVNEICSRLITSVLVDIDQTRNIMSLYGTREGKEEFIRSIEEVIHNQDSLHVETTLCLKPPRYLHSLYHFMKRVQETEKVHVTWADAVGAQVVNFVDDNAHLVQFVGYLPQYERFLNMLDEIDVKLHESVDCYPASIPSRPTCVACLNPVHANFYCLEMCGHYMCRECTNQQMFSCIRSRSFPIKCVCCEEDFAVRDIKNLLLGGTNGLPWLDSSKLFTFIRSSIDLILKKGGSNYAACLTPDCDGIFQRAPQAPGSSPPIVKCGSCNRIMCRSCATDEHPGQTCEKIKYIRENADESLKVFIREMGMQKVRKCPNEDCLAIIEKDAGCNHIQCAQCGIHFCWICQHQTTTENKMYKHLSEQHGGADGGWRFENEVLVEVPDGNEDALLQQPFFGELWNV